MNHYQLLVIGAGPGGYTAALQAAKLGLQTAVVERRDVGGTCLNRGCVPTKALLHTSQIYQEVRFGTEAGIQAQNLQICLPDLFARQRQTTEKLRSGIEELLQKAKVDLIRGSASITAPGTVQVQQGEETLCLSADRILVATGSVPARPPFPGLELPGVMTSDELLQGTDQLYRSIVIMGGGVIGVEFACFYSQLGCEVTVVEGLDRLLPNLDRELGQNLAQILKKQGVKIFTNSMVQRVEAEAEGFAVHFLTKDTAQTATAEAVLCAIGRRPNWKGLFSDDCRPETEGPRIRVNDRFETSIPGVYAIGDVSSAIQLAHVAAAQDQVVHTVQGLQKSGFSTAGGTDESGDLFFVNLNVYIFQRMEISVMEVHVFNRHLIHLIYPFVIFLAKKLETALIRSTMTSRITAVAKALSI